MMTAASFLFCFMVGAAEIKIGVAAALTGNAAQYGVPIRKGFELAVREINGSGGVAGARRSLRPVLRGDPARKKQEYERAGMLEAYRLFG